MKWWTIIKGTETATRSAELWINSDERLYNDIMQFITKLIEGGHTKKVIIAQLISWLSERMALTEGFMDDLINLEPSDGLSDVDWEEVVAGLDEEIDTLFEELEAA